MAINEEMLIGLFARFRQFVVDKSKFFSALAYNELVLLKIKELLEEFVNNFGGYSDED